MDLALLCVPAPVVGDVPAERNEAGVGAVVVYSSGFAEAGDESRARRRDLVATAACEGYVTASRPRRRPHDNR